MIDLLLIVLVAVYTLLGLRQGLVVGAFSLFGFLGGALLGAKVVPALAEGRLDEGMQPVVVLVAIMVLAWCGQALASMLAVGLRDQMRHPAVRAVDSGLGAVAGLLAICLVLWFVAGALREVAPPTAARQIANSAVLSRIDTAVPSHFDDLAADFRRRVSTSAFPRVFEGVSPEPLVPINPPDSAALSDPVLAAVRRATVKITGDAPGCDRGQEGSGVVIGPGRVMTNAHVVAGVPDPVVHLAGDKELLPATVVLFDPRTDVAVLAVPDLSVQALPMGEDLSRGDDAVVAGYPGNGPYVTAPARVRTVISATGEDIYGGPGAVRQVYSLYTTVQQGNSGGPLVAADGSLAGLVFAKSLDDDQTGYALTMTEISDEIESGLSSSDRVDTGKCT